MTSQATTWLFQELAEGRYEVVAQISKGGMGHVYLAHDKRLNTKVVIKAPRVGLAPDSDFVERFSREVRSLVRLSHPHVIRVIDVGIHDDVPFAVLQYCRGGSLESRRGFRSAGDFHPVDPQSLRTWLGPIAQALDFVHGRGYIHRDVKPANILFDEHQHPYLSDFGVAKALAIAEESEAAKSLTGTGMVLGTPQYIAPEIVLGEPLDGRSDQYSLAVTVYELLAGRPPIDAATPTAVLVAHTSKTPLPLRDIVPGIPNAVSQALSRALEKEPARRFDSCTAFAEAVLGAILDVSVSSTLPNIYGRISHAVGGKAPCPLCSAAIVLAEKSRGVQTRCPACRGPIDVAADLSCITELLLPLEPTAVNETPSRGQAISRTRVIAAIQPKSRELDEWQTTTISAEEVNAALQPSPNESQPERRRSRPNRLLVGSIVLIAAIVAYWGGWRMFFHQTSPSKPELKIRFANVKDQQIVAGNRFLMGVPKLSAAPAGVKWQYTLAAGAPEGMLLLDDRSSGLMLYWMTAPAQPPAKHRITVIASNRAGETVGQITFTVEVVKPLATPRLAKLDDQKIVQGESMVAIVRMLDAPPAGHSWRFSLAPDSPRGVTIDGDSAGAIVRWKIDPAQPPGKYPVTVLVSSMAFGASIGRASFMVEVTARSAGAPTTAPPTIGIVRTNPTFPAVGKPFEVVVEALDSAGKPVKYQYRRGGEAAWNDARDPLLKLEVLVAGVFTLHLRSVDLKGNVSSVLSKAFDVAASLDVAENVAAQPIPFESLTLGGKTVPEWFEQFHANYRNFYFDASCEIIRGANESDVKRLEACTKAVKALVSLGSQHQNVINFLVVLREFSWLDVRS